MMLPARSLSAMRHTCGVAVLALVACRSHDAPSKEREKDREVEKRRIIESSLRHLDAPPVHLPHHEYTRLLEAGAEPRTSLRYALAAGSATYRASTKLRSRVFADRKWSTWVDLPMITDGFGVTADVDPHKPLVLRPLVAEVDHGNAYSEHYLASWRKLENRRVFAAFDDRGQLGAISFGDDPQNTRSEDARIDVTQRLLLAIVQLPEEPIGIGGRWRVVDVLQQRPAIVKQTATYTLLERTPTTWKVAVDLVRNGQQQTVKDPTLPSGTDAEIEALFRHVTGTIELDPTRPMYAGDLELDARMHVKLVPPDGHAAEQLFEDTGKLSIADR